MSKKGKRLSRKLKSEATTSYSDARQRLPRAVLEQALHYVAAAIQRAFRISSFHGCKVAALDGSTVRLRRLGDIAETFVPHRVGNRIADPYWCLARVVGVFCTATGAVLDSVMEPNTSSEQKLAGRIFQRSWKKWLLLGDRNFGVYSVVSAIRGSGAHALVRLTHLRAASLARKAGVELHPGLDVVIEWKPTTHDQIPQGAQPKPVQGRLIAVELKRPGASRPITLYLFTSLTDMSISPAELLELYGQRWSVELCFRHLKSKMGLDLLECQSAEMGRKIWLAGLIGYNLIRYTMAAAAAVHSVPVQLLSFARTRQLLLGWISRYGNRSFTRKSWKRLLQRISNAQLPKRRQKRPTEPRAIRKFRKEVPNLVGSRAEARKKLEEPMLNS